MQSTLTPQPQILTVWRIVLTSLTFVPAFACSLFLPIGGAVWSIATGLWTALFLFAYLFFFPRRLERITLALEGDRLIFTTGVFIRVNRTIPLAGVQFATLIATPIHRVWDLRSLHIVAPGGQITMPGLRRKDAERLIAILFPDGNL